MNEFRRFLLNPFVLIVPVACLVGIFYYHYTSSLATAASPARNILPNSNFATYGHDGFPADWQLFPHTPEVAYTTPAGYTSQTSLRVESTNSNRRGNVTVTSPEVAVQGGHTYFFKSYYRSSVPFDLIAQQTNESGSTTRTIVRRYLASSDWTTASSAFTAGSTLRSVRFIYSLSGAGNLQLSDTYLQADPGNVTPTIEPALLRNNLPGLQPDQSNSTQPTNWSTFRSGTNEATFKYIQQSTDESYLRTTLSGYKDGEAKWQHTPTPVSTGDAYRFGVTYRGDRPIDIVTEYVLTTGKRQFVTISTLLPAVDWTTYHTYLTAPPDATTVVVNAVLRGNGTIDTKDYTLNQVPRNGAVKWKRPLLSYTFDDGWESAHQNGVRLLDQSNTKATFYINPSSIDTPDFMTTAQVAALESSGHEIASHGYEHRDFTTLNQAAIDYQLGHANKYFRQIFGMQSVNFAAPFGTADAQLTFYARKYYDSSRSTQDGINTKQTFNPYNLLVLYIGNDLPLSRLKEAIAEAQASHGWLILVYHRIDDTTKGETATTPAQFKSQLDAVRASGITVTTVRAALQEIKQQ
jgi:peptidoglycan/xylan/chitin deacetylase (PgdA/CDA1 family)